MISYNNGNDNDADADDDDDDNDNNDDILLMNILYNQSTIASKQKSSRVSFVQCTCLV